MKQAIYTFVFGGYDTIKPPRIVTPGWDYICFTDHEGPLPAPWIKRPPVHVVANDGKKTAMWHMIKTHKALPEYDLTLSIGGQIEINCDLNVFCNRFRPDAQMLLLRHPERACVYDEALACMVLNKDKYEIINAQMEHYLKKGLPCSQGLFATGVMGKRKSPYVHAMCNRWWKEVETWSKRDQLALPYALHVSPAFTIAELGWWQTFGDSMGADQSFIIHGHK